MIAKRIVREKAASDFERLGAYVLNAKGGVDPASWSRLGAYVLDAAHQGEKVAWARVSNCQSDDPGWAVKEISATQARNTRSQADKSYHLVVSFPEGERPTREQLADIEDRLCAALGFAEHQRVSAVHQNTDNWHMHIAINKVHPQTFRNIEPFRDHFRLQEACAELEVKHGLIQDNHTPERGKAKKARGRAADFEAFQGYPSFLQWVRENAGTALLNARDGGQGWQGLHRVASAYDLAIKPRGAGLVIGDRSGRLHVKASDVDRGLSIKALTELLGPYEAPGEQAEAKQPQARYDRPERTGPLYDAFKREREAAISGREAAAKALREQHLTYRRKLQDWYRQRFRQEKLNGLSGALRRQSFQHLIAKQKQDRARRLAREAEERRQLRARHPIPSWQGYLEVEAARGNVAALAALRTRMRRKDPVAVQLVDAEEAAEVRHIIFPKLRPVVKRDGRVIYRASDGGVVTDEARNVRVDQVTAGATLLALSLAAERFGDRPLVVRGTDEFRLQAATVAGREGLDIAFSDQGLERHRRANCNGLTKSLEPGDKPGNTVHVITRDVKRGSRGMKGAEIERGAGVHKRALVGIPALMLGAAAISSAATQFVAYRVGYHPALGAAWIGHIYAPWSWVQWQEAPWAAHAETTFRIVDSTLMAIATLGMLAVMCISTARRRRPIRHEGVHGTARFQTELEIRRNGLLPRRDHPSSGAYIGGWTDARGRTHYLRHDGPEHCIVIAPTRSGKGVGNIVPTLLSWSSSCLVYDEKGELWEMTAGWRAQHAGNVVVRWEPGAVAGSAGFNFLEEVRLGTPHEVADAQNIALALCDPKGEGIDAADHWGKTSFDLITALILHELYQARAEGRTASLADVAHALSNPDQKSDELWEEMRTNRHLVTGAHPVVAAAGRDMLDREARERGSVLSSAKTCLLLFKDPVVGHNTSRCDFRLFDLMSLERPVSLYIVTRGADKERLRPVVRLLLTMAMRVLMGVELKFEDGQPVMPHKHRLLLMLDEFPSLGRMQLLEGALPKCAGYGIKAFLAAQDREQMFRAYGEHQSITANCHVRIIYAPNEWSTAKWVSEMAGNTTIVKEDVTESGTRFGPLRNVSRTYHQLSRPLVTPDEIMKLKKPAKAGDGRILEAGEMVVFVAGESPIAGTQILYFLDPIFASRAAIPAPPSGSTFRPTMVFRTG